MRVCSNRITLRMENCAGLSPGALPLAWFFPQTSSGTPGLTTGLRERNGSTPGFRLLFPDDDLERYRLG